MADWIITDAVALFPKPVGATRIGARLPDLNAARRSTIA
jgi:hypothetical protein